jgi:hypothetical protein
MVINHDVLFNRKVKIVNNLGKMGELAYAKYGRAELTARPF